MTNTNLRDQLQNTLLIGIFYFLAVSLGYSQETNTTTAPFKNLDTLATNDWWNRSANPIINMKVPRDSVIAFGIYTVNKNKLKLSAQFYPLYPKESLTTTLSLWIEGKWQVVQKKSINPLGWSALFVVENWDDTKEVAYRINHGKNATYTGVIRQNPISKESISIAALSCNSNKDRGGRERYVKNINLQDPDIVFFAGDQSYDHTEHTAAWLKFGLQFKEVFRNRPCITIPDDHDVGQANLWGENGKLALDKGSSDGGYNYHPEYVKMVERCQTAHLPDPFDPTPIERGIGVYYSDYTWGGINIAILEDRKFKSGPKGKIPQQGPRPDHIRNPDYDPASIDLPELKLLGDRQLHFLDSWGKKYAGGINVVLSQTGFCGGAHIHGDKSNRLHADLDSNGWPQTGRNKALTLIRNAGAIHIAGDQHLATVVQHGIKNHGDGPWAFVVPAIVNDYYSRWWWPAEEESGKNPNTNTSLPWTGEYLDGFNNKIRMMAYVNPESPSHGGGYGYITLNKIEKKANFECWPRNADLSKPDAKQFEGWPITVPLD